VSDAEEDDPMTIAEAIEELMREIERYLAVVDEFRAAGCDVGGVKTRERERSAGHARRLG
jgi:hypothetical protein